MPVFDDETGYRGVPAHHQLHSRPSRRDWDAESESVEAGSARSGGGPNKMPGVPLLVVAAATAFRASAQAARFEIQSGVRGFMVSC